MRAALVALVLWGLGCFEPSTPHQEAPVRQKAVSVTNGQTNKPDKATRRRPSRAAIAAWRKQDAEWDQLRMDECAECVDGPKLEPVACLRRCELEELPLEKVFVGGCVCGYKKIHWNYEHCTDGSIGCERYGFKPVLSPDGVTVMRWTR